MRKIKIDKMNDIILAAAIYLFIPYKLYRKKKKQKAPRKNAHTKETLPETTLNYGLNFSP